jgi:hypothetical protein
MSSSGTPIVPLGVPVALVMSGGYPPYIGDTVDIHQATVMTPVAFHGTQ